MSEGTVLTKRETYHDSVTAAISAYRMKQQTILMFLHQKLPRVSRYMSEKAKERKGEFRFLHEQMTICVVFRASIF